MTVNNNQTELEFPIYQGENLMAKDNLLIGKMKLDGLPKAPKGEVGAYVTFIYDINGILDIKIVGANQTVHKVIMNKNMGLSEEELERKVEELKKMTLHPLEKEENRLLIEKAERLYMESTPQVREMLIYLLKRFKEIVSNGRGKEVREEYVRFAAYLDRIEHNQFDFGEFDESFWSEEDDNE